MCQLLFATTFYLESLDEFHKYILNRPGATHKARWMSKLLYCIKMELLSDSVVNAKVISKFQAKKISRFVQFTIYVYVPWWFTCPISANAPENDVELIRNMYKYMEIDKAVANAAISSFKNHLWYLTPDLVPLALFGDGSVQMKSNIAVAILNSPKSDSYSNRFGFGFGKPVFPNINAAIKVEDLVSQDSWQFFKHMKINPTFLTKPVDSWMEDTNYVQGKEKVDALKVVNDSAERGVKLANDFLPSARLEENYQNVLQVVENDRTRIPYQRKYRKSENEKWYLVLD